MAVKRDAPKQKLQIDPAVEAYMSGDVGQQQASQIQKKEKSLTAYQRRKRTRDEARIKATYDLPVEIKRQLEGVAEEHGIPKSHLAAFLLDHAIRIYNDGGINLDPYLAPSRSPGFENSLVLPKKN
jgi:hypothetical protein